MLFKPGSRVPCSFLGTTSTLLRFPHLAYLFSMAWEGKQREAVSPFFQHRFIANLLQRVYPRSAGSLDAVSSLRPPNVHETGTLEDAPSYAFRDLAHPLGPY